MLPPQLLSVITLDTVVNLILTNGNKPTPIIKLAKEIGHWIESEVNILKAKSPAEKDKVAWWQLEQIKSVQQTGSSKLASGLLRRIRKSLEVEAWSESTKVKVGGAMIALLLKSAKDADGDP